MNLKGDDGIVRHVRWIQGMCECGMPLVRIITTVASATLCVACDGCNVPYNTAHG